MNKKVLISLALYLLIHLGAIPLMSAYGLQVCPVLITKGFWAGCHYLMMIIGLTLGFNLILNWVAKKKSPLILFSLYMLSSIAAMVFTGLFLGLEELLMGSRLVEIVLLLSVMIAVFEIYLVRWNFQSELNPLFRRGWRRTVAAGLIPILVITIFNVHYLLTMTSHDSEQSFFTLLASTVWMLLTFAIHYSTENERAQKLALQLEKLKSGAYSEISPISIGGVWGSLSVLTSETAVALQERSRLLSGMTRFVSRDVAEKVKDGTLDFSGQTLTLTVLMIDLRGFTATSQNLSSAELVRFLNIYFEEVLKIFIKHSIVVDKFIGDGILAYVDPKEGDEVTSAYNASLELMNEIPSINKKLTAAQLPEIQIGVGITRGEVILGNIGGEERWQYTIIGATVNRSARLESLTKAVKRRMVLDKSAYLMLPEELRSSLEDVGAHELAGFTEKFQIFGRN
ncbi:MAG: adenylate/guanylate cyclase domain-containing protein [Bacteriovoracaceae bacterium]|nr:adenylate/guanylate cyclase domain-containing protein [Bacteriovoracaceae bacterium]